MPLLDFREALSSPTDPVFPAVPPVLADQKDFVAGSARRNANGTRSSRLGRSDWANLIFALVAFLGGLFCALCFFNGTELMRAVITWPGELTSVRPSSTVQTAKIVMSHRVTERRSDSASNDSSDEARDRDAEPFGPDVGSLDQARSSTLSGPNDGGNSLLTSPPPPSGSVFDQVTGLPPGADALSQIFDQAVAALEQAKILDAKRTVVVIQTPPSPEARARAVKAAKQQLANAKVAAAQAARNAQQNARSTAATATNTATSSTNSTLGNLGRPGAGLGGGLGRPGGIGGIGGLGRGGGGGPLGGGVGGLGGGRR